MEESYFWILFNRGVAKKLRVDYYQPQGDGVLDYQNTKT